MKRLLSKASSQFSQSQKNSPSSIQMIIQTWEKDSHGLFDYEATKVPQKKFKIQGEQKIFRNWLTGQTALISIDDAKKGKIPNYTFQFLTSLLVKQNGNQQIFSFSAPQNNNKILSRDGGFLNNQQQQQSDPIQMSTYLVVKSFKVNNGKSKGYPLVPGNIIKLGRMQYLVIECKNNDSKQAIKGSSYMMQNSKHIVTEQFQGTCKICLQQQSTQDNFLLNPCNCKGSCELIHLQCLKNWINNKVKKQTQGVAITYSFSKFECQLCKKSFPKLVEKKSVQYQMLQLQKPDKPYIMFESRNQEKNLYLITADENVPIRLGRGHQCQIRMTDISVSRIHAEVKLTQNKFYLSDYNSKFGTLIKLTQDIEIKDNIQFQCGRSVITFNKNTVGVKSSAYL